MAILRDLIYGGRGSLIVPTPQSGVPSLFVSEDTDDSVYLNYYNAGPLGEKAYIDSLQSVGGELSIDYNDLAELANADTFYIKGQFKLSGNSDLALYVNGDLDPTNYHLQRTVILNGAVSTSKTSNNSIGYSFTSGSNCSIDLMFSRLADGTFIVKSSQVYLSPTDLYSVKSLVVKKLTISSIDNIRLIPLIPTVSFLTSSVFHLYKIVTSNNRNTNCIIIKPPIVADPSPAEPNCSYLISYGGAFTLPVGQNKDQISISDYRGSNPLTPTGFGVPGQELTVYPSGTDTVQGLASLILNEENQSVTLTYYNGRWNITSI